MHLYFRISVLQPIGGSDRFVGKFPFFPNRDAANTQFVSYSSPKQETSRINPDDLCWIRFLRLLRQVVDHTAKQFPISQNRRDVFKNDSGFRKIRDISDGRLKLLKFDQTHEQRT